MNLYGSANRWRYVAGGVVAVLLLLAVLVYITRPKALEVVWDRSHVPPGGDALLYVIVRNTSNFVYKDVAVYVRPLSPYLSVFSEQNGDPRLFVIDTLPPGAEARALFLVKVSGQAYSGDHVVEVSAAFPGETQVVRTGIRVG